MHLDWPDLTSGRADLLDVAEVEISGWVAPIDVAERHDYFLLLEEPICCLGCLPSSPSACVEVFAAAAIAAPPHSVRLRGQWRRLIDDPAGWRYQLRDARVVDAVTAVPLTRRTILSTGALAALAACGSQAGGPDAISNTEPDAVSRQLVTVALTIDIHSHAGRILRTAAPLEPVAAPMREGGMAVLCLAMVADSPATRLMPDRRIRAVREPEPGELYAWSRTAFARLLKLAESLEARIQSLRGKFGEIGDARLTVMAALTVCDELLDASHRIRSLEEELEALRDVRVVAADRARATQTAVANALNSAAERIEKTTQVLNRTIGGGVAIG